MLNDTDKQTTLRYCLIILLLMLYACTQHQKPVEVAPEPVIYYPVIYTNQKDKFSDTPRRDESQYKKGFKEFKLFEPLQNYTIVEPRTSDAHISDSLASGAR